MDDLGGANVLTVAPSAPTGREEFADWVRPHWDGMARLARNLASPSDWEDVLQEALTSAWRKREQFDPQRGSARNWLLAIVADQVAKHRRSGVRRARLHAVTEVQDAVEPVRPDPDLDRALTRLTVRQRTAVVLHYYLGLPVAEVAQVMSCSAGTVKSTLSDARARLRAELGEEFR